MNNVLARGLAMLALLSALAMAGSAPARLAEGLMSSWHGVIELLEPDFRVLALGTLMQGADALVAVVVTPARVIVIGDRAIVPDGEERAAASISLGVAWLMLTVFLVTLAAWPIQRGAGEVLWRIGLGLPVLAALLLLDVPINLLGPLRSMVNGIGGGGFDAWIVGARFLRGGGRVFVAISAAGGLCLLIQAIATRSSRP